MTDHAIPDRDDGGEARPDSKTSKVRSVLEQRSDWVSALLVLATIATGFVVLSYLASYFQDYFHLILIFFFAWLVAFLISPAADFLQRRMTRLPRALAVVAVLVPIIIVVAIVVVYLLRSIASSFAEFVAALPGLAENPPPILADIQAWFDERGIDVDVEAAFQSLIDGLLAGAADFVAAIFGGIGSAAGLFIDAIIVISLGVFMAIDRDRIMRFGLDLTPPDRRADALLFRRSVGTAAAGFIRSQMILGALYGVWAYLVSVLFGLPFGAATAVLSGLIMAIPIYGPYVSWLPPVLVALLVEPDLVLVVAIVMLVGWFIDENILAPLIRAGALELHPIVVTFAFLLGAHLAGAIGAVVAIPMAAVAQAFFFEYLARYRVKRGWPSPDDQAAAEAADLERSTAPVVPTA
jgi:predicted PurR-regulated permease PerM